LISRSADDLIDIMNAPLSFIEALMEEQPAVDCDVCLGEGCDSCFNLGFHYILIQT
jgi:hypothetical protein